MLTLDRLLHQPGLGMTLLVRGDGTDREIVWLHSTELPDPSPYLRTGELVLTNGVWADETSAEAFVDAVVRAGGRGIVFGLRDATPVTPIDLVEACRHARLPLAEVSTAVPFTTLTRAAASILADGRIRDLTDTIRRGSALASAVARGIGAIGMLEVVREEHHLPLGVVDRTGRQLAQAGAELSQDQLRSVARGLARRPPPLELDLDGVPASLFLVSAVGEVDAALICLVPYEQLSVAQIDSLRQVSTFLSLEVAKQQAVHAIEQRFAAEVLDMVQAGPHREHDVAQRLRAFGVDPRRQVAVLAVATSSDRGERTVDLTEAIDEFLVHRGLAALVAQGTRETLALVSWPHDRDRSLHALAEDLRSALDDVEVDRVLVAVGGVSEGVPGLRDVLARARETSRTMQLTPHGPDVQAFADLGNHRLLLGMLSADARARFSQGVLGALREHDGRRGGDLEVTLRAFLEMDGRYAETASRLHVHVNTLRQRLGTLTELTGRDPRRTSDRVDLFLALEADALP